MIANRVEDIRTTKTPGSIEIRHYPDGVVGGVAYICPKCGEEDYIPIGVNGWEFHGSEETPTLSPSVLHRPCGYHGYLKEGIWEQI